jgi:hypothetical protein
MVWLKPSLLAGGLLLAAALSGVRADAGHELVFYPSYYVQEITIDTLDPPAATAAFQKNTLHAFVGGNPFGGQPLPKNVSAVESLGAYVVVSLNGKSPALGSPAARCATARKIVAALAPGPGWTPHPYPVTPHHPDYLQHVDLAAAARKAHETGAGSPAARGLKLRARGALARSVIGGPGVGDGQAWDAVVEEVSIADLVQPHPVRLNGWAGPPWMKDGWFHAYLLQAPTLADATARQAAEAAFQQLAGGAADQTAGRLTLERALVAGLQTGCERVVAGYTLRREPINVEYSAGIENVALDSQTGLASAVFPRTVKLRDFPWNGWVTLGVGAGPAAAWNPVAGFTDPAGGLIWSAVSDLALFPEPFSDSWTANRVRLSGAESAPATQPIAIPRDAVLPESGTGLLKEVGDGKTARTKLTYRVLTSMFHDSTRMTVADALYGLAFAFRWGGGRPGAADHDPQVARATALARESLAGLKVLRVETDRLRFGEIVMTYEIPVVEVYLTRAAAEPQQLAPVAPPWSTVPWHALALMEEAVSRNLAAFSADEAKRRRVPWLDLVRDARLAPRLTALLEELEGQAFVPAALRGRMTEREARHRWGLYKQFVLERRHFLVTNGPYQLKTATPGGAVLQVFRDFNYPLGVGHFNAYAIPLRAYVARTEVRGDRLEVHAEVERIERFAREFRLVTEPLSAVMAQKDHGPVPVCRYVVLAPDGKVVRAGAVDPTPAGLFSVSLEGLPRPGRHTVVLALPVGGNRVNLDIRTVRVE